MSEWSAADEQHMRHALGLAALGVNSTDPNPRVGCVLVRDGRIIGEGWHERAGLAHAEVRAIESAGAGARGATAYVTLEPCSGHGRTPPCTAALLAAGVTRVVFATADPNPAMRAGAARLRDAGCAVAAGLLAEEARALNIGFFARHERGRPWVRVKLGASLDGRTALANGESRWITGKQARADAQLYRARSSVVLTGIGTVLADDPAMNVRLDGANRQPLRVVLDSRLRLPLTARIIDREGAMLLFTAAAADAGRRAALEQRGVRVESLPPAPGGGLDLNAALVRLAELQANEVWVEAGPAVAGALLAGQLADELVLYLAPCLLGPQALPLAQLPPLQALDAKWALQYQEVVRIGADLRITARPLTPPARPPRAAGGLEQ